MPRWLRAARSAGQEAQPLRTRTSAGTEAGLRSGCSSRGGQPHEAPGGWCLLLPTAQRPRATPLTRERAWCGSAYTAVSSPLKPVRAWDDSAPSKHPCEAMGDLAGQSGTVTWRITNPGQPFYCARPPCRASLLPEGLSWPAESDQAIGEAVTRGQVPGHLGDLIL